VDWLSNTNALVGIIAGAIAIYSAFAVWRKRHIDKNHSHENPAERFIQLFESHGVARSQIPAFFGHELSIGDCSSPDNLLHKLSEATLKDAADLFGIKVEWLHGTSSEVYAVRQFYKYPKECADFFNNLVKSKSELSGIALVSEKLPLKNKYSAAIVVTEEVGAVGDRPINRLHILGNWVHSYWKCRGYFAACVSIALSNKIRLRGRFCHPSWLAKLSSGETLPRYDFESGSFNFEHGRDWNVDEFLNKPDCYLKGVDPEENKFGLHSALELWLSLEKTGYIHIDECLNQEEVRSSFEDYRLS
jgi:hypothetical protein